MARPALPYGDGLSGHRIAGIIDEWLAGRAARRQFVGAARRPPKWTSYSIG
jgi:hypothetical protein